MLWRGEFDPVFHTQITWSRRSRSCERPDELRDLRSVGQRAPQLLLAVLARWHIAVKVSDDVCGAAYIITAHGSSQRLVASSMYPCRDGRRATQDACMAG
jgi:hypothetical protein